MIDHNNQCFTGKGHYCTKTDPVQVSSVQQDPSAARATDVDHTLSLKPYQGKLTPHGETVL